MQIGKVVLSLAGRDKGKPMAVIACDRETLLLCDGKERPLERPKRKNPKHIRRTEHVLSEEQLQSNRSMRRALSALSDTSQGG